jgi:hypothetical protein
MRLENRPGFGLTGDAIRGRSANYGFRINPEHNSCAPPQPFANELSAPDKKVELF